MEFFRVIFILVGGIAGIYLVITGLFSEKQISQVFNAVSKWKLPFNTNNNFHLHQQMHEDFIRNQQIHDEHVRIHNQMHQQAHNDAMSLHDMAAHQHHFDCSMFNNFPNM